ncbi:MAG: hypothetical protein U0835_00420 [Isosphaeraceae bacterium]
MSMGTTAAIVAAAEAERLLREEEEEMTPYSDRDLAEGWEFKILRASTAAFRNPERLRAVLEEEKQAGWVLVEKFDDARIRLKRPAGAKMIAGEFADGYDPYRTVIGVSADQRTMILLAVAGGISIVLIMVFALINIR